MKSKIDGVIDRFEGDYAVILVGPDQEETIDFPKSLLPKDVSESDLVSISVSIKKNKTERAKKEVMKMIDELKKKNV